MKPTPMHRMRLSRYSYTPIQRQIIDAVQVNIPYTMLVEEDWRDLYLSHRFNPEIGMDAAALDRFSASDFAEMAARFHDRGLRITLHGPFLDLSPGSPDRLIREATRRRYEQLLTAVSVFSPQTVVCHAGYDESRYDFCREAWLESAVDTFEWLGKAMQEQNTKLMLENVYETVPDMLIRLFSRLDPAHIGCCLDAGHLTAFGDGRLDAWLEALGSRIGQFHLHDNSGAADAHLGMGEGRIDFKRIFEFMEKHSGHLVVTLEPHTREDFATSLVYLERHDFLRLLPLFKIDACLVISMIKTPSKCLVPFGRPL